MESSIGGTKAADLAIGDLFVWCDRLVQVDQREVVQRRWSIRNGWNNDLGLYLMVHETDGTAHRLHYYSDEVVPLAGRS